MTKFTLTMPPKPEGYWVLCKDSYQQICFAIHRKPNRFHRFMTKLLLDWDWKDND